MYNENACAPTNDIAPPKPPLSELLAKLNDLSYQNLDLATLISNNLFGSKSENDCTPTKTVECMEDAIKSILENAHKTNAVLVQIRERM